MNEHVFLFEKLILIYQNYKESLWENDKNIHIQAYKEEIHDADFWGGGFGLVSATLTSWRCLTYLNVTHPSFNAYRVKSLPIPTLLPGWNFAPRCRTMIFPGITNSLENIFNFNKARNDSEILRAPSKFFYTEPLSGWISTIFRRPSSFFRSWPYKLHNKPLNIVI